MPRIYPEGQTPARAFRLLLLRPFTRELAVHHRAQASALAAVDERGGPPRTAPSSVPAPSERTHFGGE
jgi:hypothetical protein